LNASNVASTPLRLYVRTKEGQKKTRWRTRKLEPVERRALSRHLRNKARANSTTALIGFDGEVEEVTDPDHPINRLLAHPEQTENDLGLSMYDHRYMTQLYVESVGRAYWYIGDRDAFGVPKSLNLLRSHFVREVPDTSGEKYLAYYEYGGASGQRFTA